MVDNKTVRKRVLLRLLGSPLTVLPFLMGMTALTASWALDWNPGIGAFAGLVGTLTAAGLFFSRLLLQGEQVAQRILTESAQSEESDRQQALDDLDKHLTVADKDPRPETALRDMRALVKALQERATSGDGYSTGLLVDINIRVSQLFDHCVASIQETDRLWQTAQKINTPSARQPLLDQREKIINEIQDSVKQLSQTLVALQSLGGTEGSQGDLARLRDELDQSLVMARTVESRVNDLVSGAAERALAPTPEPQLNK